MPPVAIAIVAAIFPAAATTFVLGVSIATIIGSIIGSLALSALAVALSSKSGRRDAGIRVNSTITGGTAAQFFPVGVTATKGAFAYPKLTHGGKGGTQFLTHVIVLGHKPHIRINRVALEGEWADIDWTRGAGSTASTPTETPSDTGGLPTPTRPRAASPTLLITTATTVTGGAFCTFQYDDNSSFSSPSAVYDTAKNNSHAALWTLPAGTTYVRARLTTGIRDTGSKSAWSPTSTHTRGATTNTDSIYLKSIARPDTPTGGTSTENHTPTGWSRSSLTPTQRQNVYRVQRTRTYTDGVFISATAWAGLRVWRRRTSRSSGPRGSQIPRAVGDDSDSSEYGSPVLGTHEGFAFARYYDGTQTAADPMMLKMYGNHPLYPWTADMIGAGISYVIMTYKRDPKVFTSEPDPIFEVQGIPLYDIRKDSTKGGSGAHRWGTESTYEYTENPMVIAHNLALGISLMGGYTYGGNWDFGMIPANTIIAAMNECDAKVTERGASVPKYRCGLELAVDEEPRLPMDEILKSCSGRMAYSRGSLLFRVGAPTAPVLSLNNSQELISQPATYSYFPDAGKMYNGVRTRYPEPLALWSEKEAPAQYVSAYLTEDREWVNIADVTLPAVPFPDQAWRLSNAWLKDNRRTRRHILRFPLSTLGLEPMDTINYTDVTLGYTDKLFEIDQIEDDHERNVRGIHIREIDPSDYDAPALYPDAIPTSSGTPTITAYTLTAWTFSALDMVDSAGRAREAGVLFTVTEDPPEDIEAIEWELYLDITGAPILSGTTDGLGDLIIPIFQGILPFTTYHGRLKPLSRQRETTWTALKSATTSDIRLSLTDLGADVQAAIAAARPDGTTAAEAAETAQRLAVAAQNLAEAAKTDAEAAQLAAETAQGLAETAKADSEAIQTAVNAALSDAETAETAAETAQGLAEIAKTAAEIAKGLAEAAKIASENSAAASKASSLLSGSAAGEASASEAAAAISETNAEGSASTAATSETNAATSKTQAGESASAASTSASTASTQAGIATTKAGVATTQAGIATTKAGEASTSETNAATSRTNAETSESNAATSARNAATSKTAAGDSASAASTSSSTATTQAGIATTKAGEAATKAGEAEASATTASEKAGEATTKAGEASTSASTATTQAGIATTKAGEASTSETSAATSKTNAKTSESNAKTSETNAANSESAAGTSETNARDSASAASRSASTASTKADEAGTKASTATIQAGIATTKAGEASTSASNAAISETNAEGSASSAAASASLVAVARTAVVASFNDGDGAWVGGLNRNKAYLGNAASLSPSAEYADVSLVDVEGTGQVLQFDSVYRVIFQRNIQSFVEGQQLRVRIKTRLTTDPTSSAGLHNHRLFLGGLASDGTNLQEQEVTEWTGLTVADGWIIREIVIDAVALRTASTRTFSTATEWFLGITGNGFDSNVGNAVQQFAYVSIEDVTVNAGVTAAARAAQTSASVASAKADEAEASAATATTQAGIATTKAGEASTSETNAATSKTGAGISETNAATSARNAATSKTQAGESASAASGSASTASTKADEAGVSASAASASKDTATTKAGEASTSASEAATSETNAETSESSAATSARNAATSKTQAGESASAASGSASTASTKADEASTSASTATTQAGIATTKAGEASTSETSAATSETNAEGSESNAATSARNAAISKTAAGVSASAANASAMSASTKADEAGVSATAASGSVDRVVTKAAEAAVSASNAATSETNAETAQAFAERARGVAARVYHGEAFNNPIFATWTATYPDGVAVSLSIAKTGDTTTDTDYVYRRETSAPSTPTGGTSTLVHTPTGWSRNALTATATQNVYASSRTRTYVNGVFTSATSWSTPTLSIAKTGGLPTPTRPTSSAAHLETTAANVSGGAYCTFQYDDNSSFSSPSVAYDIAKSNVHAVFWTAPSGTIYIRARLTTGIRDTGSKSVWSPMQTYPSGDITTTDTDYVYRLGISTLSTPTGGTSTLAHTPTGWSRSSLTASSRSNVYRVQRVRTYVNGVFTSATSWSTPTLFLAKTGDTTTDTDSISRLGTSAPTKPTGGTSTLAHTPTGWSRNALTATTTQNVYVSSRVRTYVNGVFISATSWSTPTLEGGTVTKDTTGKYGNAILVNTGANPSVDNPQLRLRGASAQVDLPSANDCIGLSVSLEIEAVSGTVQGGLVRAMWDAGGSGGTSAQKDYFIEDEIITSAYGIVRNLDLTFPRPPEYVAGSSGGSVQIVIYATSAEGGNTRSQAAFKIHRWNVRALSASANALLTQSVKADLAGIQVASFSLEAIAGSAGAELQLTAFDDSGERAVSAARISADNILLDGSVHARQITISEYLDIDESDAGFRMGKTSALDLINDGTYMGRTEELDGTTGFGFLSGRTSGGASEYIQITKASGLRIKNASFFIGSGIPEASRHVTTSQTYTLGSNKQTLSLRIQGGGRGGTGGESSYRGSSGGVRGTSGSRGGASTVILKDGDTTIKTWRSPGSSGLGRTANLSPNGDGGVGGRGGARSSTLNHRAGRTGSDGTKGGYIELQNYDISALTAPKLTITIGAGGAGGAGGDSPSVGVARNGRPGQPGVKGKVIFATSRYEDIPAAPLGLEPSASGTFSVVSRIAGTFPQLSPTRGLWTLDNIPNGWRVNGGSGVLIHEAGEQMVLIASATPTWSSTVSQSKTVVYHFYPM